MSQENVEVVRMGATVFNEGDVERWLADFIHPEIVWRTSVEDPDAATHYGLDALRRYVTQWQESFEGLTGDIEECINVGDERVFTWVHWTGRGTTSRLNAEWWLAINYTMRDAKVVRAEEFFDRNEALKAVGLEE